MENTQQEGGGPRGSSFISRVKALLSDSVKKYYKLGLIIVVLAVMCVTVFFVVLQRMPSELPGEQYTLVADKISQSAPITVLLPPDTNFSNFDPKQELAFSPVIKGEWESHATSSENRYRFLPSEKLTVGAYYLVTLDAPELKMEKMFSVDKDPSVLAIFPKQEAEVNEYSNITIMFSRPMVALSALGENADIVPPVLITPYTEGRWKWITTRTLQFIPTKRLLRSSSYTVSVKDGFRSLDGVSVPAFAHAFTTRTLSYQYSGVNDASLLSLTHDQPVRIYFNQPIDLEKTRSLISVSRTASLLPVSFVVAYGTRSVTDEKTGKTRDLTDQSVLELFPEKDRYGRAYLWDFDETYGVALSGAVPLEGDIKLSVAFNRSVRIAPIIENVSAESPRSNLVTPELFDPTGTLVIRASEPIDLHASNIAGKGIQKLEYGQKCPEPAAGEEVSLDLRDCAKVDDQKSIRISFNADEFVLGETAVITMTKLVNMDGIVLNTESIVKTFTTFPKFTVVRTTPKTNAVNASLTAVQICSTNPLVAPIEAEFYKKIRSNMMIGLWNWDGSFLVTKDFYRSDASCPSGTFQTTIRYGLVPKFGYELTLDLDDHFGQHLSLDLRFTTADADPLAKGFAHLQPTVVMTPPDRTTLTYGLDFMNAMDMTICRVSAEMMLSYRAFPKEIEDGPSAFHCIDKKTKHLVLPESYATRKYLRVDLRDFYPDAIGNYVVIFSNPGYRKVSRDWKTDKLILGGQLFEKTYVTVTRLAVGSKQVERSDAYYDQTNGERDAFMKGKWPTNLYWVNDFKSLTPSIGAVVTPYIADRTTMTKLTAYRTDNEGIATTPSADDVIGAVVTADGDSAVVSNKSDALSWAQNAGPARREYVYTDRPIYRPGDTVHVKGISRIGYDAKFELAQGKTKLEIRDAKYGVARTLDLSFSKNGTYESSFVIDTKAPLGYYSISSDTGGYWSFQVEEYVAPQFKVDVAPDKEEYISGDTAAITIAADYYFGVPVQNGDAEYRIVAQDYYFDRYSDGYFSFGRGWYDNENGWYGDHFIASGKLKLAKDGKGAISKELNIDKLFTGNYKEGSKVVSIYVTVKNENGQSVTKQQSFIVHRGTFYAGISMDEYFVESGKQGVAHIKTVDVKGKPVSRDALTLSLDKVEWKSYKRQEVDGNFYYRTERVKAAVSSTKLNTDESGNGSYQFTAGEAGEYELSIIGTDERGNAVTAQYPFYVSGSGAISIRPTNNATLELVAPKTDLAVGATGSFVIKSPYPHAKALVTLARGSTYLHKVIDLDSQLTEYRFTATEEYIPNVIASVLLLAPLPEMKYGEVRYTVGAKEKELTIEVVPGKKTYLPGEEVSLAVTVKDANGRPVQAELSLAVVDMSVLALVGNPKKHPVTFFYNGEPLTIRTAMNVKNVLNIAEIPIGTKGGGGGEDLEKKKRGEFRDTAFWEGVVETDANGKATATFMLPDNLTQWQVESVGVTKETKIGVGYSDFTARKSIMAVPLKPRFILPGDSFAVGGTIFNESDKTQKLNVSIVAPTLTLPGSHETTVVIEPHASISISFPAVAPEAVIEGSHEFTLLVKNNEYEDVVVNTFPIERNDTYEFTATAGRVTDANWKEQLYLPKNVIADRGMLTLSLSATMASLLDSAVMGMIIYPYECSEQVASKLRTIAIVKQNAQLFGTGTPMLPERVTVGTETFTIDQIVENGLAKLYQAQTPDGGMPYYANLAPDFGVTLETLETYIDLKKAGYKIDADKLTQSAQYVFNYINYPRADHQLSSEDIIVSSYVLSKVEAARFSSPAMREKLLAYAGDKAFIQNGLSTPALAYLAILAAKENFGMFASSRLFAEFENRSNIDARGTTIKANTAMPSRFAESAIVDTALALKAFSEAKRDSPLLEGFVRALKTGRSYDGGWASTYNSIIAIDAVTEYLKLTNEANAHMSVALTLDGTPLLSPTFNKANILTTYATTVPMSALKKGESQIVQFLKKDLGLTNDAYYYDMLLRYYLPAASIAPRDEGFSVVRALYRADDVEFAHPVSEAMQGDVLHGRITVSVPVSRFHVAIEDRIPAGTEIVNQRLATEDQSLENDTAPSSRFGMDGRMLGAGSKLEQRLAAIFSFGGRSIGPNRETDGILSDDMYGNRNMVLRPIYPSAVEAHDDRLFVYVDELPAGEYVYDYYLRVLIPGTYQHLPLVVSEMYTPENFGRTAGGIFTVVKKSE
ncbi:MAG: hypothetical protein A2845_04590 [Candidatus Lloydbacteria bacterium RIFCSPHIGHO2_01_FULL_49_22]|uniref:Alpha-2-macroglobulin domain-containing protein n=1 Tax=Candidatus Lloydbacteria bacterium RIFCSPHIGHO2_01_FULL_49_22 TaxID=1798658 RepID=A0A1G2CY90_9BACT|nr:MAG: hypothetical protein A2845_04590 [Candidatus Lloydbacteria bacterium RIFCSPHIGHO2_01_FULL_49_22]OGZ10095.1 MAG: hypothetical protein A3C14_00625 [Candidatus Lloydbacteria bacterium RIFCSPHIGHO2_02_FULL_50_18]